MAETKEELADRLLSTTGLIPVDVSSSKGTRYRWLCQQIGHDTLVIAIYRTWHPEINTTHTMWACKRCQAYVHKTFADNPLPDFPQKGDTKHEFNTSWVWTGVVWTPLIGSSGIWKEHDQRIAEKVAARE